MISEPVTIPAYRSRYNDFSDDDIRAIESAIERDHPEVLIVQPGETPIPLSLLDADRWLGDMGLHRVRRALARTMAKRGSTFLIVVGDELRIRVVAPEEIERPSYSPAVFAPSRGLR